MYLVVRTYEHTDSSFGEEGFRRVRDDLLPSLTEIDGFINYYSAYDTERGVVTSVSVYVSREAAEEANRTAPPTTRSAALSHPSASSLSRGGRGSHRIAVEWGSKNLAGMGTVNPTAWVGDVLVAAEGLLNLAGFRLQLAPVSWFLSPQPSHRSTGRFAFVANGSIARFPVRADWYAAQMISSTARPSSPVSIGCFPFSMQSTKCAISCGKP